MRELVTTVSNSDEFMHLPGARLMTKKQLTEEALKVKAEEDELQDRLLKRRHVPNEVPELVDKPAPPAVERNSAIGRLRAVVEENLRDKEKIFGARRRAEAAILSATRAMAESPCEANTAAFVQAKRDLEAADLAVEIFPLAVRGFQSRKTARTRAVLIAALQEKVNELEAQRDKFLAAFEAIAEPAGSEMAALQQVQKNRALAGLNAQIKSTAGPLNRLRSAAATYADVTAGEQIFKTALA